MRPAGAGVLANPHIAALFEEAEDGVVGRVDRIDDRLRDLLQPQRRRLISAVARLRRVRQGRRQYTDTDLAGENVPS